MSQLLLDVVFCVVDTDYIRRVEQVPRVLLFVNPVFLVISSSRCVVQCGILFSFNGYVS